MVNIILPKSMKYKIWSKELCYFLILFCFNWVIKGFWIRFKKLTYNVWIFMYDYFCDLDINKLFKLFKLKLKKKQNRKGNTKVIVINYTSCKINYWFRHLSRKAKYVNYILKNIKNSYLVGSWPIEFPPCVHTNR